MTADEILKKHEDDNEYHFHSVDRKWIIEAMEEYAALRQPLVISSVCDHPEEALIRDKPTPYCLACNKNIPEQTDL
jgi:hypothetical protein